MKQETTAEFLQEWTLGAEKKKEQLYGASYLMKAC